MEPMPSLHGASRLPGPPARGTPTRVPRAGVWLALMLALIAQPDPASAEKVRITNLSDVDFGLLSNLQADSRRQQNICLFSSSGGGAYSVAASGSGAGSAFTLSNGSNSLVYEVEWSNQSGQSNGSRLTPNAPLSGRTSS